ncbi:DNA polymerase III subunit gamma and tau [Pseudonocardia sp. C8]|nr:DNA polymerase III subunit gamma and tau [Pseudonocardia sp. C8]MBC3194205.1 DNA polymerase III subunit gamma and tau [Pseudonocardia sp. C8]
MALYRKYRPAKLADVVGQEHVTEPLATALSAGRINHAYLFSGPRGCGKTSSARILARSLNCEQGPTPDPCGECASCVALAPEGPGSIDVVELDAASHGGVEDARELRDRAFYAPAESRYRVFVVDEAHMVTNQGFNALLKIVEEPPEHLVFVFATTEPDKVLPTIRSRTHHYPFRLIPPGTMRSLLERICGEEHVTVAPPVFPLVIRAGGGSARDTLSVLDQLLAGAGPEGVTYDRAVALLGVTDSALIDDAVDALAAADSAAVYGAVDRLVEAGHDPRRFASDLLQRFRDLMLIQAVPDAAEQGLVDGADDELSRMADQAARLGAATLTRYGEILHQGLIDMRGATAPRLLLELLCARMLLPAATTSDGGLLERLERIERRNAIVSDGADDGGAPAKRFVRPSERAAGPADPGPPGDTGAADSGSAGPAASEAASAAATGHGPAASGSEAASGAAADGGGPGGDGSAATTPSEEATPPASTRPVPGDGGTHPADAPGQGRPREATAPEAQAAAPTPPERTRPAPPRDGAPPDAAPPASAQPAPAAGSLDATAVRRVWSEILSAVRQRSRSTEALLVNATVRAVDGDTLVLAIAAPPLARRLSEQRNTDVISEALRAVLGVQWRVRCDQGEAAGPPRRAAPERPQRPVPQRPSQQPGRQQTPPPQAGPARRSPAPDGDIPLPPEPPPEDAPPDLDEPGPRRPSGNGDAARSSPASQADEEEAMLAEAAAEAASPAARRDPEAAALGILKEQLGARTIEPR